MQFGGDYEFDTRGSGSVNSNGRGHKGDFFYSTAMFRARVGLDVWRETASDISNGGRLHKFFLVGHFKRHSLVFIALLTTLK